MQLVTVRRNNYSLHLLLIEVRFKSVFQVSGVQRNGENAFALLNKTHHEQWKARRSNQVGETVQDINTYLVYRAADVMELLRYDVEATWLRALAATTGANKPAYIFHDTDYVDTVVVHDSDSEVE